MAVLKCKMCGGDLNIVEGETVAVCEYCDTKQTVPTADNEKKMTLFARANRLRAACEFDKAAGIYENIVADFPEEAEAFWGLVLCKFGIEYVDDPATGKKIPTCHRSSFDSIMDDSDFEQVMENADAIARRVYREEAKAIEELRKNIIEVSSKEEPYDIFICYKETDENGSRTIDSVIAQDVYDALTERGYKVFFSRITLEDKLGQEYEPYIFSALHSAKVMLAFGTDYDYYNAVWVKNEWSRFLALIAKGEKKNLIPCYKDIDAYDMPKEFRRLQAQDMGKVGAIQDLLRGIEKLLPREIQETFVQPKVIHTEGSNAGGLLKRAYMFLEDGKWDSAKDYCDRVLDIDPENGTAYLGLAMAKAECRNRNALVEKYIKEELLPNVFDELRRAEQFSDHELKAWFSELDNKKAVAIAEKERKRATAIERLASIRARIPSRGMIVQGASHAVGIKENGTVVAVGENKNGECDVSDWTDIIAVAAEFITVGLKADGTVVAVGDNQFGQCNVSDWTEIVAVSTCDWCTVGLRSDGTVVAVGMNDEGQCNVSDWKNITAIAACGAYTLGLKADGTVVATGDNYLGRCNVTDWTDITAIVSGGYNSFGLKSDGTVVAVGDNECGQCNLSGWNNIVAVSASEDHTVGLKSDGTVVAVGENDCGQCEVSDWTDIVAIVATGCCTIGLKANGTVLAVGDNQYGQCDVSGWTDIVEIEAFELNVTGLKSDGTVVAVGLNDNGQCDVFDWKLFRTEAEQKADYTTACVLQDSGEEKSLAKAAKIFSGLKDINDSNERAVVCKRAYEEKKAVREEREAREMVVAKKRLEPTRERIIAYQGKILATACCSVGLKENGKVIAIGRNDGGMCEVYDWNNIVSIAGDVAHIVGLRGDGTVAAVGGNSVGQCNVSGWRNIKSIATGWNYTVGLTTSRTVVATGRNEEGQCNVSGWRNIVSIAAANRHTIGLEADGTVVATGDNQFGQCDVSDWTDITAIATYDSLTAGLKADGTVVATGENDCDQCEVSDWKNIISIAVGFSTIVGLKADGTVIASNKYNRGRVSAWSDIVAISSGSNHTVGLKADGTVVAFGSNSNGECDVSRWSDIVAISASFDHTMGLKADGTVVAVGYNDFGACNVSDWKLFRSEAEKEVDYNAACLWQQSGATDSLKNAVAAFKGLEGYKDSVERAKVCMNLIINAEKSALQTELSNLKGFFSGKRRKQIEARLAEIEDELKRL